MSTCDGTRNIRAVPRRNQRHERLTKTVVTSPLRKSWPSKPNPIYTLEGLHFRGPAYVAHFVELLRSVAPARRGYACLETSSFFDAEILLYSKISCTILLYVKNDNL